MSRLDRIRLRLRMDPPVVLLEKGFLEAVASAAHPEHDRAVAVYGRLIDDYEAERVLLRAVDEHVPRTDEPRRRGRFAPVESLHVAGQHRRAVDLMLEGDDVSDPDLAMTLVMLERHAIRRIATFDARFAEFDLDIVLGPTAP
jgi:predicted nucleic acid-binding protein